MTIDADTKLEWFDYNLPGWVHVYNKNIDLLNDALLKIRALTDVNKNGLQMAGFLLGILQQANG